jgi:uncharacterized protein YyaL (SSP411 family)
VRQEQRRLLTCYAPGVKRAILLLLLAGAACRAGGERPPAPSPFRFSPRPNRAAEIHWRVWDPSLFADSKRTGKPILLSLSAIWCHWCHVLDETTLSDPKVIALLNERFLTVRVDADQHPDLERRYILGGWPTVAFLTANGEIIDGGTYVPTENFLAMADGVLAAAKEGGASLEQRLARHRSHFDPTRPGPIGPEIVEGVTRTLTGDADLQHGGFGGAPKFPHGDAVVLLFDVGETDVARRALDGMLRLEDPVEGGFFRYATRADWSVPHYEKMLSGNAELLEAYARGFQLLKDERYRTAARRIVAYLRATLSDESTGQLYASQDADEAYYAADAAARKQRAAPYLDRTLLTDRSARMIVSLEAAARDLADPSLLELARKLARPLLAMQDRDGRFLHARRPGVAPEVRGQLADQAWAALALHPLGGEFRAAATRAIDATLRTLAAPTGGLYDADAAPDGLLSRRERPLEDNAVFARALLAAGRRPDAERVLAAFAGAYLLYGIESAGYARAVQAFLTTK